MREAKSGTSSGITCTVNSDGSYTYVGTATQEPVNVWLLGGYILDTEINEDNTLFVLKAGKTYYTNDVKIYCGRTKAINPGIHTFEEDFIVTGVRAQNAVSGTTYNEIKYPIVAESNIALDWQPYGASPSPDYPAKVHCLGDDKNLFDINSHIELENAFRLYNTGTNSNNSNFYGLKIPVDPKEEYISSSDFSITGISNLCFFDKDMTYISGLPYNTSNRVFNTPEGCAYITLAIDKRFKWFKLQKGTVATPWSPFGYGTTTNKSETINKYNKDTEVQGLVNSSTGAIQSNTAWRTSDFMPINSQKYTFAWESTSDYFQVNYNLYDINKNFINSISLTQWGIYLKTFEITNQNAKYLRMSYSINANNTAITRNNIMLLEGEYTAANLPDYVLHEEDEQVTYIKEPLLSIGDVRDEQDLSNKKIVRRFTKIVLDGTTNKITGKSGTTYNNMFMTNIISNSKKPSTHGEKTNLMCTHFNTQYNTDEIYTYGYAGIAQRIDGSFSLGFGLDSEINTVELANAYLAEQYANGTPVEVIYELATPIIEDIDCSDKIAQFDGQTTIYNTDGAELECTLTNNRAIAQTNENLNRIEKQQSSLQNYSTEEQIIGKWIDGKPIYRKVISGNAPAPDSNGVTWYNITNNVQDLVNVYGNISQRPYNYILISRGGSYCPAFDVVVNSNTLRYRNLGVAAGYSYQITLEYTKTTD